MTRSASIINVWIVEIGCIVLYVLSVLCTCVLNCTLLTGRLAKITTYAILCLKNYNICALLSWKSGGGGRGWGDFLQYFFEYTQCLQIYSTVILCLTFQKWMIHLLHIKFLDASSLRNYVSLFLGGASQIIKRKSIHQYYWEGITSSWRFQTPDRVIPILSRGILKSEGIWPIFLHSILPPLPGCASKGGIRRTQTIAQCVHCTVGFPCSKKSPVVATGE